MKLPKIAGTDEAYAKMAFRILVGPRDIEWHNAAVILIDEAPDYAYERDSNNYNKAPRDVYEIAGRILGYCAGLVEWTPEVEP